MQRLQRRRLYDIRTFILGALLLALGGFLVQPVANTYAADETMVSTVGFVSCGVQSFGISEITVDPSGSLYVVAFDSDHSLICKLTGSGPAAVSTVLAGGAPGYADGTGVSVQFGVLKDITSDSAGNIYVIDDYRIRKITPAGVTTTIAGSTQGSVDGAGVAAQFQDPSGITLDVAGNIYVKDLNTIRKITPAGVVTTAVTGTAGKKLARDTAGNFYFVSSDGLKIQKVTPAGVVTLLAGSTLGYVDGTGAAAQFETIRNIEIDSSSNIYVIDYASRLRKVTPAGEVTTIVEGFGAWSNDGPSSEASFESPQGIAVDSEGNLFITEWGSGNYVRKVTFPIVPVDPSTPPAGTSNPQQPAAPNTGVETKGDAAFVVATILLVGMAIAMIAVKRQRI